MLALRGEAILFEQVEDRDAALLLDIGRAPQYRALVERDINDARIGHNGDPIVFIRAFHKPG